MFIDRLKIHNNTNYTIDRLKVPNNTNYTMVK